MPFQSGATPFERNSTRCSPRARFFPPNCALSSFLGREMARASSFLGKRDRGSRVGRVGRIEAKRNCAKVRNSERAHTLLRNELDLPASSRLCARKRKEVIALRIRFSRQPRNVPFRAERKERLDLRTNPFLFLGAGGDCVEFSESWIRV